MNSYVIISHTEAYSSQISNYHETKLCITYYLTIMNIGQTRDQLGPSCVSIIRAIPFEILREGPRGNEK